jgi:hypothetical protein
MTLKHVNRVMRAGSIGAGVSVVLLIAMAFVSLPAGMSYPGLEALTGALTLTAEEQTAYLSSMQVLYLLDGIFLLGWAVAWVGLAELVSARNRIFGVLTLVFGLAGALCDFCENSIIWSVLQSGDWGVSSGGDWVIAWKAVQHMSYWLPFLGAVLAACGLWSEKALDRLTAAVGGLLVAGAAAGLYFSQLSLLSNLWFLFWFACLAWLLWRRSAQTRD